MSRVDHLLLLACPEWSPQGITRSQYSAHWMLNKERGLDVIVLVYGRPVNLTRACLRGGSIWWSSLIYQVQLRRRDLLWRGILHNTGNSSKSGIRRSYQNCLCHCDCYFKPTGHTRGRGARIRDMICTESGKVCWVSTMLQNLSESKKNVGEEKAQGSLLIHAFLEAMYRTTRMVPPLAKKCRRRKGLPWTSICSEGDVAWILVPLRQRRTANFSSSNGGMGIQMQGERPSAGYELPALTDLTQATGCFEVERPICLPLHPICC